MIQRKDVQDISTALESIDFKAFGVPVAPIIRGLAEVLHCAQALLSKDSGNDGIERMRLLQAIEAVDL